MLQIFKSTIRTFKSDKSLITKCYLYVLTVDALYNNIIFTYCRMYCMTISLYKFEDALYDQSMYHLYVSVGHILLRYHLYVFQDVLYDHIIGNETADPIISQLVSVVRIFSNDNTLPISMGLLLSTAYLPPIL